MSVVFPILDATNFPLNFQMQQWEHLKAWLVVHQDRPTMMILACSAAYGYSIHSPKNSITLAVPYTSSPIGAKIPSGVHPKLGIGITSTIKAKKSVIHVGIPSSSMGKLRLIAQTVVRHTLCGCLNRKNPLLLVFR
jgi:hypothetical protein